MPFKLLRHYIIAMNLSNSKETFMSSDGIIHLPKHKKFPVLVKNALYEQLQELAKTNRRGVISEVNALLEEALLNEFKEKNPLKTITIDPSGEYHVSDVVPPWIPVLGMLVSLKEEPNGPFYRISEFGFNTATGVVYAILTRLDKQSVTRIANFSAIQPHVVK